MQQTPIDPQLDPIEYLVHWWFIGYPHDCSQEKESYRVELRRCSPENVQLFRDKRKNFLRSLGFDPKEPPFCAELTVEDYVFWSKNAYWQDYEAVALSFGKNPEIVTREWLRKITFGYPASFHFVEEFNRLGAIVMRAEKTIQLKRLSYPGEFLSWAKNLRIKYLSELEKQVLANGHTVCDWRHLYEELVSQSREQIAERDRMIEKLHENVVTLVQTQSKDKPLHTKERSTMLKIIGGMALAWHGYDPEAKRSGTAQEITSELARVGVELSDDTVRNTWTRARNCCLASRKAIPLVDPAVARPREPLRSKARGSRRTGGFWGECDRPSSEQVTPLDR